MNSAKLKQEFYFALMWHREGLTSPKLIGSSSTILQMILMIIFIVLAVQVVDRKAEVKL